MLIISKAKHTHSANAKSTVSDDMLSIAYKAAQKARTIH